MFIEVCGLPDQYQIESWHKADKFSDFVKLCDFYCKAFLNQRYTGFSLNVNPKPGFWRDQTFREPQKKKKIIIPEWFGYKTKCCIFSWRIDD